QGGSLIEVRDFESIIDTFSKYKKGDLCTEFSGVEYSGYSEVKLTAIKHGDLKFETLSEVLADLTDDVTIISSSPLLEHDSQYMNIILLRTIAKKLQKKESRKNDGEVEKVTRSYPVKKGTKLDVDSILKTTREVTRSGTVSKEHVIAKIPGLERVELWGEGKNLLCEITADKNSENYVAAVKKFNELIEALTGYSAKERKKIVSKAPKE
ncbi:AP endonuclease, family 2, partial [mine drainage metagenome]